MTDHDGAERPTARDFDPELLRLFDRYVHGLLDRRAFLEAAGKFAVAGVTAASLLDALSPRFAQAQKVPAADPRIAAEYVEVASPKGYGKLRGYLVRPAKARKKKLPGSYRPPPPHAPIAARDKCVAAVQ